MNLNEARKLAGMPPLLKEASADYEKILEVLISKGALTSRDGIEWVYENDDDEVVKGPDGKEGWFNDAKYDHATEGFDPAAVRKTVEFLWFLSRMQERPDREDLALAAKMIPMVAR